MSLWNRLLGKFVKGKENVQNKDAFVVSFDPFNSDYSALKECNATYMSCISTYANAISKIKPALYFKDDVCPDHINYVLGNTANKSQSSVNFWKQSIVSYFENNLAAIYLDWDYSGPKRTLKGVWAIDVSDAFFELLDFSGTLYFSFRLDSKKVYAPMEDMVVLVNIPSTKNPFITHSEALTNLVNAIDANFKGLTKALEMANVVRFIATANTVLPEPTIKQRQKKFSEMMNSIGSDGVFYTDNAQSMIQVTNQAKWASADDIKEFKGEIYDYFHVSQSIVNGTADDETINSWVELYVEPILQEIEQELTEKLLTQRERDFGNAIKINTSEMFTASVSHRIELGTALVTSGVFHPNEFRKIVGLRPLPKEEDELIKRIDRVDSTSNGGQQNKPQKEDKKKEGESDGQN